MEIKSGGTAESDIVILMNSMKWTAYKHKLRWDKENGVG